MPRIIYTFLWVEVYISYCGTRIKCYIKYWITLKIRRDLFPFRVHKGNDRCFSFFFFFFLSCDSYFASNFSKILLIAGWIGIQAISFRREISRSLLFVELAHRSLPLTIHFLYIACRNKGIRVKILWCGITVKNKYVRVKWNESSRIYDSIYKWNNSMNFVAREKSANAMNGQSLIIISNNY